MFLLCEISSRPVKSMKAIGLFLRELNVSIFAQRERQSETDRKHVFWCVLPILQLYHQNKCAMNNGRSRVSIRIQWSSPSSFSFLFCHPIKLDPQRQRGGLLWCSARSWTSKRAASLVPFMTNLRYIFSTKSPHLDNKETSKNCWR